MHVFVQMARAVGFGDDPALRPAPTAAHTIGLRTHGAATMGSIMKAKSRRPAGWRVVATPVGRGGRSAAVCALRPRAKAGGGSALRGTAEPDAADPAVQA